MTHIPDPPAEPDTPPLNRTISPIAQARTFRPSRSLIIVALGLLGGGAILLVSQTGGPHPNRPQATGPAKQVVRFEAQPRRPTLADPGPDAPSLSGEEMGEVDPEVAAFPARPANLEPAPSADTAPPEPQPSGPLVVYRQTSPVEVRTSQAAASEEAPVMARADRGEDSQGKDAIESARAAQAGDRTYRLLAGAILPCLLQTALDSSRPGHATCLLPSDVYSDNGATVLLEKGTRVLGRYDAGLASGDQRLLVRWLRAVTPNGVTIWLDAPAADALGRSGLAGELDTRFWSRFGGAVLLSLIDQAQTASSRSDGQVWVTPSQAPAVALESSINLPPRLVAPQGMEVSIFVTHDLDFSGVYDLRWR